MDTYFGYCDKSEGFFSSDERVWINRIRKLQQQYPDKIKVIAEPETNDGCIYVKLPTEWLKVQPPRQLTPEQKAAATARLRNGANKQQTNTSDS